VNYLDNGTSFTPVTQHGGLPPVSGAAPIPKDVAGAAAAGAAGTVQGNIQGQLPLALASADRMVRQIDEVLNDPGLDRITGPVGSWTPHWFNGDANRAESRVKQIFGGTFLQAYNDLRGAGQISNAEGQAAEEAYNRLHTLNMNDADYKQALIDFRNEVLKLAQIAKARASGGVSPANPGLDAYGAGGSQPAPAQGSGGVIDYRDYFGIK